MRAFFYGSIMALLLSSVLAPAWAEREEDYNDARTPATGAAGGSGSSFGESFKGIFGIVNKKIRKKSGVKGIPTSIAVLPAVGGGDDDERRDVTEAIHNSLGTSRFALLKPGQIRRGLDVLEVRTGAPFTETGNARLAEALRVDGLLFINVDDVEKVYAAAYAHYKIEVTLRLYSLEADRIIWAHTDSGTEREGGISLNVVGMITTAVTAANLLSSEATRLQVINELARKFSQAIPQPATGGKIKPPHIQFAMSNALEGPFRAGDELKVWMQAEPDLVARFAFAGHGPVELREDGPGEYTGRYVVRSGDELDESIVEIEAVRLRDKARRHWRLAGRIGFDTMKPASPEGLRVQPDHKGLRLEWPAIQDDGSEVLYRLERADAETGKFDTLTEEAVQVNVYLDRDVVPGKTYVYRVTTVDAAGNNGGSATVTVSMVRPGPTSISGDILSSAQWTPLGSPYRLRSRVALGPAAELTLQPGTVLEFAPETEVLVDGRLYVEGNESMPVVFSGDGYRIRLNASNLSDRPWRNLKQSGSGGTLVLDRSQLRVERSDLNGLSIHLEHGSRLTMSRSVISDTDTAVRIDGGQLYLDNSEIAYNKTGIEVESILQEPAVAGRASRLSHNQIHIRTLPPLTVAGVALAEERLESALAKLAGPVAIDWQSLSGADNLEKAWVGQRWQNVIPLLQKRQWDAALEVLLKMEQDDDDIVSLLRWITKKERPRANASVSEFLSPVKEELLLGTPLTLWLHGMQIPNNNSLSSSDVMIVERSRNSFTRSYLNEHFNRKRRTDAFVKATRLPLHKAVVSSQVGFRHKQGLVSTVWIFHVLDNSVLQHQLAVAGLLERKRPDFVLAVAIDGSGGQIMKGKLFSLLDRQNIPFMDLSDLRAAQRIRRASEQKADLLLSARVLSAESTSTLAENLKVIDLDMTLRLEELKHGRTIGSYHREAKVTAFKKSQGLQKAIVQSLRSVQDPLLSDLFSYSP